MGKKGNSPSLNPTTPRQWPTRSQRRAWWKSLTPQQQADYRAKKDAEALEESLNQEFRAIVL